MNLCHGSRKKIIIEKTISDFSMNLSRYIMEAERNRAITWAEVCKHALHKIAKIAWKTYLKWGVGRMQVVELRVARCELRVVDSSSVFDSVLKIVNWCSWECNLFISHFFPRFFLTF